MQKNPNGYFYRHCEPGEAQAAGGWTEAEVDLFVKVAEKWGAGDKWGLFSSHIPKRVGYQCSAVYRQVSESSEPVPCAPGESRSSEHRPVIGCIGGQTTLPTTSPAAVAIASSDDERAPA